MLVLTKLIYSFRGSSRSPFLKSGAMSALLSSAGNVSVFFLNSIIRKQIGSARSLAASRNAHEGMVEGPNGLNFPRARSVLRHSILVTKKEKVFFASP